MKTIWTMMVCGLLVGCATLPQTGTASAVADDDYYENVNPEASRSVFISQLRNTISSGTKKLSYKQLWAALPVTDFASDKTLFMIYTTIPRPVSNAENVFGPGPGAWNREHTWPVSRGIGKSSAAYTDLFHLRPADRRANGARGNTYYDEVKNGHDVIDSLGIKAGEMTQSAFEPLDSVKGDVARMLFYMEIRYLGLKLVKNPDRYSRQFARMGNLCTLLAWHTADPVDEAEELRNEAVFEIQQNRNPFIDHPDWVGLVWPEDVVETECPT